MKPQNKTDAYIYSIVSTCVNIYHETLSLSTPYPNHPKNGIINLCTGSSAD